jgi:hypothetical protein
MGLRLDFSTASTVSSAKAQAQVHLVEAKTPGPAISAGFIGDGPGPYNASFLLEGAMLEPVIVNVNIAKWS